jgi:MFS family permease
MAAHGLGRQRLAVAYLFALSGINMGAWAARTVEVKNRVGLSEGAWGTILVANTVGMVATSLLVAALIGRVGVRRFTLIGVPVMLAGLLACALAKTQPALALALFAWGVGGGITSAPLNALAVGLEQDYARPIMISFHACFSGGLLSGSLLTAGLARAGVGIVPEFAGVQAALALGFLACVSSLPRDRPRRAVAAAAGSLRTLLHRLRRRFSGQLLLIGLIASCTLIAEGAANSWSSIYVGDSLHASAATAALAPAAFAAMQLVGRLLGDRLVLRLGRSRFLVLCGLVASLGLAWGLASGSVAGGILAFAATGGGLAGAVPTAYAIAGNQPRLTAGEGVAAIILISQPAFMLGPLLIGWIAQPTSVRVGLFLPVLAVLAMALLAFRVRDPGIRQVEPPEPGPAPVLPVA